MYIYMIFKSKIKHLSQATLIWFGDATQLEMKIWNGAIHSQNLMHPILLQMLLPP